MLKTGKKGFTLIELLAVIAIIGVLASVVLASLNGARKKSRDARRLADIKQLQNALELFSDANSNVYPSGTSLTPLTTGCSSAACIPAVPNDPLNTAYSYTQAGNTSYVLRATLENASNPALSNDIDGSQSGINCADASGFYCVRP